MLDNLDQYRLRLRNKYFKPLIIGGMGVDISTDKLALVAAKMGGIGHISDAMMPTVTDKHYKKDYSKIKYNKYKDNKFNFDKSYVKFDIDHVKEATQVYVSNAMAKKTNHQGLIFINCMEKLLMNSPQLTLKARLEGALDGGVDGITMSAGLHLYSFELIADHKRFNDAYLGIIVSSVRALKPFLKRVARLNRLPDYIVVEGPMAGGHLGFGADWREHSLAPILADVLKFLAENDLKIPVIAAGGVFTGTDAVNMVKAGAAAVQVATRFTVTKECGLPERVKQLYFQADKDDAVVSNISPTGYPMRILTNSPGLKQYIRPNCESYGYLLDKNGHCAYIDAYQKAEEISQKTGKPLIVEGKVCLCTHMRNYKLWTCGENVYRLKDTTIQNANKSYHILDAEHVFNDYLYSLAHKISLPEKQNKKNLLTA